MANFWEGRFFRCLLHIPVGIICAVLCMTGYKIVAAFFFLGFALYELNEDSHLKDNAWKDLFGFLVGLPIAPIALLLVRWLS